MTLCFLLRVLLIAVEVQQRDIFLQELRSLGDAVSDTSPKHHLNTKALDALLEKFDTSSMQKDTLRNIIDASLSTFLLHVESRVASSQGLGKYLNASHETAVDLINMTAALSPAVMSLLHFTLLR